MAGPATFRRLTKYLSDPLEQPVWPEGICLATFDPERDGDHVHALLTQIYAEASSPLPALDAWRDWLLTDPDYAPDTIFLARGPGKALVGICLCWKNAFIKDLAVAASHRRHGIGKALLLHSFAHFAQHGYESVELKVEIANRSGAERLYRSLGMTDMGR
ncbi:GNAT family N-acetyltransferase [Alteraurantiacibacter aestuarii]|uniref:GNAT family N-acetyltransferase n=1 Tax=Alteraurantiacibacter aestuarii TaxID=650004 RepID=A0A844ZHD5_9SPHN|nr:N-acetyltransferase [Alteraurantiacibacter aestuarii]MXO87901.1 GNAT family N-acetyltransferase [Alteraurantiacibacter aestuarii]